LQVLTACEPPDDEPPEEVTMDAVTVDEAVVVGALFVDDVVVGVLLLLDGVAAVVTGELVVECELLPHPTTAATQTASASGAARSTINGT
jgi:hypothetical protein